MSMTELHANSFEDVVTEDGVIWDCLDHLYHIPDGSYRLRTVCPDYNNPSTADIDLIWESDYAVSVVDGSVDQAQACRAASHLMDCVGKRNRYLNEIWWNSVTGTLEFKVAV